MAERARKQNNGQIMHLLLIVLFLFLSLCLLIKGCTSSDNNDKDKTDNLLPQDPVTDTTPAQPNGPSVVATASIGITGSMYIQDDVIRSALTEDATYDFTDSFSIIKNSYESFDYMIAHLETTFGGTEAGEFTGKDSFNAPDEFAAAMKAAGIDMVLTSNNHCYDTQHSGFLRTQEVLKQNGLDYTGTKSLSDDASYLIKDINGIKIGMICYTHETGDTAAGNKTIRDITVASEDTDLINSFNYRQMDQFYSELTAAITEMESAGADFVISYIHWGNEFDLVPSNTQKKIAQNLCDLGIDIIIGSHPHTVQPVELLTSTTGETTFCFYSLGNALSSQRRKNIPASPNGYTEDGMILSIQFQRWSDGSVKISDLNATPLWVDAEITEESSSVTILPVDVSYNFYPALSEFADSVNGVIDPSRAPLNIEAHTPSDPTQISASYSRTMDTILEGLNQCRQHLGLTPVSNISGN